jgi:death-on-curing protein
MMRYITLSELIYINGMVLNRHDIATGKQQIRDVQLLEAAVQRPQASAFGQDAYPTLRAKVAALMHSVARNHPFTDGNKRTATVGAVFMLRVNGEHVIWLQDDAEAMIVGMAEGSVALDQMAAWFPLEAALPSFEPDSEADMALIQDIIREHKGLLDALERR